MKKEDIELLERVFNKDKSALKICVGSWYAYNSCNKHALGSCYKGNFYIDFSELESVDELYHILELLGWSEQEREELFVQDLESDCGITFTNCDYTSPASVLETILENNIDLSEDGKKLAAILDLITSDFDEACTKLDEYDYYPNITAEEYEEELFEDCMDENTRKLLEEGWMSNYIRIDYEAMARDDDHIHEFEGGLLVEM